MPFYFYDEFMKHNDFYDDIEEMLDDPEFQSDYDTQEDELKKLRKKIKKGETPQWMTAALAEMHAAFPEGASLRYRSSTNNEDLPGFSGAGLYDSKTQHPEETVEDGIAKSLKQVFASLWNFRAFTEREFHRIDHLATAMGVLVHPNYSDERANGVAVSFDPIHGEDGYYYINTQLGEDLVTNPEAQSAPEEIRLHGSIDYYQVLATSNQAPSGRLLLTRVKLDQLRDHLTTIHERFATLYGIEAGEPFAMEIEFKITSEDILAIKQARPWVFSDDVAAAIPPDDIPDTWVPIISGIVRVGETLTADTSGIADDDELTNAVFAYQWLRGDTDIAGATGETYTLVAEDEGRTIKVRVSFTDDRGNEESLTSDATPAVVPERGPLAGFSLVADGTGVELVALVEGVQVVTGDYSANSFAIRANLVAGETVGSVRFQLVRDDVTVTADGGKTESYAPYSLYGDGGENSLTGAPLPEGSYLLTATAHAERNAQGDVLGRLEVSFTVVETAPTPADTPAQQQQEPAPVQNSSATGVPIIGGSARVGETLTADVSGISDDDDLTQAVFNYQWLRGDAEIPGANGDTYTLVEADAGQTIKVRVSFTDAAGHAESLTSDPTGAVEAKPNTQATGAPTIDGIARVGETLTADTSGITNDDKLTNAVFSYQWLRGNAEIAGATGSSYTLVEADEGQTIEVKVSFTDDAGHEESLTSDPTGAVDAKPNSPATGAPTIDGKAQVGETLTADTSGIDDADGLTNAAFAYQWRRGDAEIAGATSETYTLVSDDEGKTVKVRVSFTDDAGHAETRTSAATAAVDAMPVPGRPQDLAGEASAPGIQLTWQAPSGSSVTQYVVYRGILQNGSMNGQPMTKYATIDATGEAMAYTDASVESGVEYRYRVAAVNSAGEGKKSTWLDIAAEDSPP